MSYVIICRQHKHDQGHCELTYFYYLFDVSGSAKFQRVKRLKYVTISKPTDRKKIMSEQNLVETNSLILTEVDNGRRQTKKKS